MLDKSFGWIFGRNPYESCCVMVWKCWKFLTYGVLRLSSRKKLTLHRAAETVEMEKTSQGFWRVPWEQAHWELWNEPPLDRSGLTSQIPFMASLWIRSGYDMKVGKSAETYQVGAHFKALIKAILVAPSRTLEKFFFISCLPAALCKLIFKDSKKHVLVSKGCRDSCQRLLPTAGVCDQRVGVRLRLLPTTGVCN